MEFETYESELADYSLQDSPFYEASTPIIFDLTTTSTVGTFVSNRTTSMADALNLSSKKKASSIMMSTLCQSLKLELENSANNERSNENAAINRSNQIIKHNHLHGNLTINHKHFTGHTDALYSTENMNFGNTNSDTKKKRKCVTFLPNYVQVIIKLFVIVCYCFVYHLINGF